MEAHPIADLFPMLAEDELTELAADIKLRGLLQPIVLDAAGKVLDGRNRLAACKIAKIKPTFTTYDGDDPDGYALAVNINRRSLTKGQTAMVIARADRLFNLKSQLRLAAETGIPNARFSQAKTILEFAPDKADGVAAGTTPLNEAYEVARQRKRERDEADAAVAEVRAEAPDLADEIAEERLSLAAAKEFLWQRRADAETRARVAEIDALRDADGAPEPTFRQRAEDGAIGWDEALTLAKQWQQERADSIRRSQGYVRDIISAWKLIPNLSLDTPDNPYVRDILDGLDESERSAIQQIIGTFGGAQ